MTDMFTLIHAEKATHSVELMTRLLHVSRAGYYSWVKRRDTPSPAATRRAEVTAAVIHSHTASFQHDPFMEVMRSWSQPNRQQSLRGDPGARTGGSTHGPTPCSSARTRQGTG